MNKKIEMADRLIIDDLDTLKALSDPFRLDLLQRIMDMNLQGKFATVKELAEQIDLPPTKLYYHVNLLEKHGLLLVGETQVVSGIIEKRYQVAADEITVDKNILHKSSEDQDEKLESLLGSIENIINSAYLAIQKSLKAKLAETQGTSESKQELSIHVQGERLHLTTEQYKDLKSELENLSKKYLDLTKKNLKNGHSMSFNYTVILNPNYHQQPNSTQENKNE